jgi:glycosyltransferase involved in cell wall biosynthesis
MKELVSIIIPVFNKAAFLDETLTSVCAQTYASLEVILIDDASTDHSLQIMEKWKAQDSRIKVVLNTENLGGNKSRNLGINLASGKYTLLFDADDLLSNSCIANRINQFDENTDVVISSMGVFNVSAGDVSSTFNWTPTENNALIRFLRHDLPWTIMQPLWKTKTLQAHKGFDENFRRLQDVELHTRMLSSGVRIKINSDQNPDCFYRIIEGRHSMEKSEFYTRWVQSASAYFYKFKNLPAIDATKELSGTLIETASQLLMAKISGEISPLKTTELFKLLLENTSSTNSTRIVQVYFSFQNSIPFRIKGLKKAAHLLAHGR